MAQAFDYIVIGAGSAGCAVAYRLVNNTDARVLLIEAGRRDTLPEIHSELLNDTFSLWGRPEIDWGYVTEEQASLNQRSIPVARGKVWGGCSSVNAMLHVRGSAHDFDHWNYLGNEGWSYADVLPYFKRMEDWQGGASEYRGAGGPLSVIRHDKPTPASECLFDASVELGFAPGGRDFDYNGAQQSGSAFYYQANKTQDTHQRASEARAYLYPILDAPNFTLLDETQVTKLVIEGGRVKAIDIVKDGRPERIEVEREVIVACGAYESPKLLMLSGIGPAATLQAHDIDVVADLPGVGQNLQDHMLFGVAYLSRHAHPHDVTLLSETGLFTHTRANIDQAGPDLQIKCGGVKFVAPQYDKEGPGFTFAPVLAQPQSVGYVTLRSANPGDTAIVQPNFLSADVDVRVFLRGIELARELAHTSAFKEFTKEELAPGADVTDEAGLREFIRSNATTVWHPVGTCKMGHDTLAVVDPQLRVHGIEGLRVADASIMPRIVSGNTNAACVMIGEKAADLVTGS